MEKIEKVEKIIKCNKKINVFSKIKEFKKYISQDVFKKVMKYFNKKLVDNFRMNFPQKSRYITYCAGTCIHSDGFIHNGIPNGKQKCYDCNITFCRECNKSPYHNNELCNFTDEIIFDKPLKLVESTCSCCSETKLGIIPNCEHFICVECFKNQYTDVKMPIYDLTNKDAYFEELNKWDEAREMKRLNKFLCLFCLNE